MCDVFRVNCDDVSSWCQRWWNWGFVFFVFGGIFSPCVEVKGGFLGRRINSMRTIMGGMPCLCKS